ncbi:hypothetical protein FKM82_008602 [Ascaphus truei]
MCGQLPIKYHKGSFKANALYNYVSISHLWGGIPTAHTGDQTYHYLITKRNKPNVKTMGFIITCFISILINAIAQK